MTISHDEAKEIASRLIAGAFRREDKRPQFSIPANPDRDDDLRMMAYIEQQAGAEPTSAVPNHEEAYLLACMKQETSNLAKCYLDLRSATIERCAQVAETCSTSWHYGPLITAEIRKLKDKP